MSIIVVIISLFFLSSPPHTFLPEGFMLWFFRHLTSKICFSVQLEISII